MDRYSRRLEFIEEKVNEYQPPNDEWVRADDALFIDDEIGAITHLEDWNQHCSDTRTFRIITFIEIPWEC